MEKSKIGFDINLGMPDDFTVKIPCETVAFDDINKMIRAFVNQEVSVIFAPCGTLPYLNDYAIISQSLFGTENKRVLQTNMVTKQDIIITDIMNFSIGRVNKCCTTSFWAPLIYLMNHLPENTLLKFRDAESFQDMLFKTAEEKIASSMVWDIILQQNAQAADQVHELFNKKDLPCPILIAHQHFSADLTNKINNFKTADTKAFFRGFCQPDLAAIKNFQNDMRKAIDYFQISIENPPQT